MYEWEWCDLWGGNVFTWRLSIWSIVWDCRAAGCYWKKLDATHQSFTLVFFCFWSGTSRFQPCRDKTSCGLRIKLHHSNFFFFLLNKASPAEGQLRWTCASTKHSEPSTHPSELQHRGSQALFCVGRHQNATCATCFSLRQRGGNWSKKLCLSNYLRFFVCLLQRSG